MKDKMKKHFKKAAAFVLTVVLTVGQIFINNSSFTAMVQAADYIMGSGNSWSEPYLQNLLNRGVMRGDQDGNMDPDRDITRAEFVSMLNRAFGYTETTNTKLPFKDIDGKEWYADDIKIAYDRGYFAGTDKNKSDAQSELTREQAVSLLCRNLKVEDVFGENFEFKDSREFQEWSKGSINAATQKGYVSGYEDGTFRPRNNITRGETAKLFSDAIGELISEPVDTSFGTINGNATISSTGVTLRDTIITGDLYITSGVGTGYTHFVNVQVLGEVIVSGAGESNAGDSSILFTDSIIPDLTINGPEDKTITLKIEGSTNIDTTTVKSDAYLEELTDNEGGFNRVIQDAPEDSTLYLAGSFNEVTVKGPKNNLTLGFGSVNNLIVDEDAIESTIYLDDDTLVNALNIDGATTVGGPGEIAYANINAPGVVIDQLPDEIVIRPGITAKVNGKTMTSKDAFDASSLPRINASYPKVQEIGEKDAVAVFEVNKPGTLYWVVTLKEDDGLDEDEIMKPKSVKEVIKSGNIAVKTPNEEFEVKISGLEAEEKYTVAAVLEDDRGDISVDKMKSFTTEDDSDPAFLSGYPKVIESGDTYADIAVIPKKDCKLYWAVFPKGSVAPTERELIKDRLSGEIESGSEKNCDKNEITEFKVTGMKEATEYDFYVVASDGTNYSKVTSLKIKTKDKTPPKFLDGYPVADKNTDKSVDVKVNVDEDCTIYYVVCKRGEVFPKPVPPATEAPALNSEEAKKAVITANNAIKSGKASAKLGNESKISMSGLEAETAYDVYMLAQDADGNSSDVVKLYIKTRDVIPPTAKLEFEETIEDIPTVESEIYIVFSEEVWDAATLKSLTNETLAEHIVLYDMSAAKKTEVPIDFSLVKIEDKEGHTVLTFPKESTNLNSGNKYQFELSKIVDTSVNKMSDKTQLDFQTVAPLVELIKTVAPEDMDMTFELEPQAVKTADNVLFDIIFYSNTTVEFDLYQKDALGEFVPLTDDVYHPFIMENEGLTLHYILDRKIMGMNDYAFEQFNQLENREYGIRFRAINGNNERDSWSQTVKMNVKCLIGSKANLSIVAGSPVNGFETALNEGAIVVNYPTNFELLSSFTDTVIPQFMEGYPKLNTDEEDDTAFTQVGDTKIFPLVRTTKKATFYYLIAPRGVVTNPNPLDIMSNALKPQGGISGKYEITNADTEFEVPIDDLQPNTEYDMFCFLKGTPPETSPMKKIEFTTKVLSPPVLALNVTNRGEDFVEVTITADKSCTVDWIMFPSLECPPLSDNPSKGESEQFAEIIRNGAETTNYKPVKFGSNVITVKKGDTTGSITVRVDGLERNIYYTFFAVAKSPLGGGDSEIARRTDITPADVTPPAVIPNTVITGFKTDETTGITTYNGVLSLVFSEPIYYIMEENGPNYPMTATEFQEGLSVMPGEVEVAEGSTRKSSLKLSAYTTKKVEPLAEETVRALSTVQINFRNVYVNSVINYRYLVCDKNRNVAGMLQITFVENADPKKASWDVKWVKDQ